MTTPEDVRKALGIDTDGIEDPSMQLAPHEPEPITGEPEGGNDLGPNENSPETDGEDFAELLTPSDEATPDDDPLDDDDGVEDGSPDVNDTDVTPEPATPELPPQQPTDINPDTWNRFPRTQVQDDSLDLPPGYDPSTAPTPIPGDATAATMWQCMADGIRPSPNCSPFRSDSHLQSPPQMVACPTCKSIKVMAIPPSE